MAGSEELEKIAAVHSLLSLDRWVIFTAQKLCRETATSLALFGSFPPWPVSSRPLSCSKEEDRRGQGRNRPLTHAKASAGFAVCHQGGAGMLLFPTASAARPFGPPQASHRSGCPSMVPVAATHSQSAQQQASVICSSWVLAKVGSTPVSPVSTVRGRGFYCLGEASVRRGDTVPRARLPVLC